MAFDNNSYIFRKGVTPNTLSVISSKNRIYANNSQIGVVATFDPSEARTVEPVRGIGFGDQIAELVPGVTDPMTISVTRTALYLSNVMQAFGYKAGVDGLVRSLRHHRWPFDIRQEIVFSELARKVAGNDSGTIDANGVGTPPPDRNELEHKKALITFYLGCWMSDYSVSYAADTALVQETCSITVSTIVSDYSFYGTQDGVLSTTLDPDARNYEGYLGIGSK